MTDNSIPNSNSNETYGASIRFVDMNYSDALNNTNSDLFKQTAKDVCSKVSFSIEYVLISFAGY